MTATQMENKWMSLHLSYKKAKKKEPSNNPRMLFEPGKATLPGGKSG